LQLFLSRWNLFHSSGLAGTAGDEEVDGGEVRVDWRNQKYSFKEWDKASCSFCALESLFHKSDKARNGKVYFIPPPKLTLLLPLAPPHSVPHIEQYPPL
jgi:hypothetical protein